MRVDVLLDTFGAARWTDLRDGALAAEDAGLDGLWLNDHLAGSIEGRPYVLECWTILSALAAEIPRVAIGPLVLNVANRDPGTLAVMAATLQHVSAGRLLLGLGAGGGPSSPYAAEQEALGRPVASDSERRGHVERAVATLREVWTGAVAPASGFLQPSPPPPIIIAGFGPKMAELAGRVGDGICVPAGPTLPRLVAIARKANAASQSDRIFMVAASLGSIPNSIQPWTDAGIDRLIVNIQPPYHRSIERLTRRLPDPQSP